MNYFACHYSFPNADPDVERVRPQHRAFLDTLFNDGRLVASGPYTDGGGSALVIIRLPEPAGVAEATSLMDADPYVTEGVLTGRFIRQWNPVKNVFKD